MPVSALCRRRLLQAGAACVVAGFAEAGFRCCRKLHCRILRGACRTPAAPGPSPASAWSVTRFRKPRSGPTTASSPVRAAPAPRHAVPSYGREPAGRDTTVHWHGIRLPNAMDGVPGLTHTDPARRNASTTPSPRPTPARSGTTRTTTAWCRSGRGLAGVLIVEERDPSRSIATRLDDPGLAAGTDAQSRRGSTTAWKTR